MTATPPRRESLARAFAPTTPDRAASLRGLLPAREHGQASERPARTRTSPPPAPLDDAPAPAVETPDAAEDSTIVNLPAYLPPELLYWLRATTRSGEMTYADVLFDAFENVDLPALANAFAPRARTGAGGVPRRPTQLRGEGGVQRQFRVTTTQRAWVDAKVTELGAPSRSALCTAVLERYRDAAQ